MSQIYQQNIYLVVQGTSCNNIIDFIEEKNIINREHIISATSKATESTESETSEEESTTESTERTCACD